MAKTLTKLHIDGQFFFVSLLRLYVIIMWNIYKLRKRNRAKKRFNIFMCYRHSINYGICYGGLWVA